MNLKIIALGTLILASGWLTARAQTPGASQQSDSALQRQQLEAAANLMTVSTNDAAPELYPGETSDIGPQSVVQPRSRSRLQASLDEQYFYSGNVFLANKYKQKADILVSTLNLAFTPAPVDWAGGALAPRLGYQHQWFTYGLAGEDIVKVYNYGMNSFSTPNHRISIFNFNSATPFADLTWTHGDWTVTLGEDLRWLLDSSSYDQFYREFVTRWSAGRTLRLSDTASIYAGYQGDYRFTQTHMPPGAYNDEYNDRTDQGLVLVGSFRLCAHAVLQPYDLMQYSCYTNYKRHDYLNTFGLALNCQITPQIALRAFVSYDIMHTDGFFVQSYQQLSGGGGLNLTMQF